MSQQSFATWPHLTLTMPYLEGWGLTANGIFAEEIEVTNYIQGGRISAYGNLEAHADAKFSFHEDGDPNNDWIPAHQFLTTGEIGFFDATPRVQYTFGDATASGSYGATEQTMLQKCYDALRAFGLAS